MARILAFRRVVGLLPVQPALTLLNMALSGVLFVALKRTCYDLRMGEN